MNINQSIRAKILNNYLIKTIRFQQIKHVNSATTKMKISTLIYLCNIVSIHLIYADECYVCDAAGCDRPGAGDIQTCTENELGGKSGKTFVNGALGKYDPNSVYNVTQNDFNSFLSKISNASTSQAAAWTDLTRWVKSF